MKYRSKTASSFSFTSNTLQIDNDNTCTYHFTPMQRIDWQAVFYTIHIEKVPPSPRVETQTGVPAIPQTLSQPDWFLQLKSAAAKQLSVKEPQSLQPPWIVALQTWFADVQQLNLQLTVAGVVVVLEVEVLEVKVDLSPQIFVTICPMKSSGLWGSSLPRSVSTTQTHLLISSLYIM